MQGAWRQSDRDGREMLCIFGESNVTPSADEQQAINAGCSWTGGYCSTLDGRTGGEFSCPPGAAARLGVEYPGPGQAPQDRNSELPEWLRRGSTSPWVWVAGAVVLMGGVGALLYWNQKARRRELLEAELLRTMAEEEE